MKHASILLAGLFILTASVQAKYDPNHFDPDNAAHWYRKAFELYEEPNDVDLSDYAFYHTALTPEIEKCLLAQKPVIDLLIKATDNDDCNWEINRLDDPNSWTHPSLVMFKKTFYLLLADGRFNSVKRPDITLRRIEQACQMAHHLDSGVSIDHLAATGIRAANYNFIRLDLNHNTTLDLRQLNALKTLLDKEAKRKFATVGDVLDYDIQYASMLFANHRDYVIDELCLPELAKTLFTEDFFQRNLDYYKNHLQKLKTASQKPYAAAIKEMEAIDADFWTQSEKHFARHVNLPKGYKLTEQDIKNIFIDCDFLYLGLNSPFSTSQLSIDTRVQTQFNALRNAVRTRINYQKTKTLPEKLPVTSPKDMFSGKPFLIVKTENGFTLKCPGKDMFHDKNHEYEFALPEEK